MSDAVARVGASMTDRTVEGIRGVLAGNVRWHSPLLFAGPAVIASIAYMDPGNFATNIQAGAKYGYALLWVVLIANVTAMLYQALSAKLGIVTGRNLAEMCRDHFPKPVVWGLWIVSEVAAMATDLAEFLGGAIGLSLLLHIPLIAGMGVTAVLTYGILMFEGRGFRPIELIIGALVAAIALCYLVEVFIAPIDWAAAGVGSVLPQLQAIAPYPVHPIVRPVHGSVELIKQYLDIGAQTLIIPMVESEEQARRMVAATRYPTRGVRGVGTAVARASRRSRACQYEAQPSFMIWVANTGKK